MRNRFQQLFNMRTAEAEPEDAVCPAKGRGACTHETERLSRIVATGLISAVSATSHAANPLDLTNITIEQLLNVEVVTASKIPQRISEAPSVVSVVTADDIKQHGYQTLAEILNSVRGVYISYDRNYSYVGTRGSGRPGDFNTRLLILIDGRRLNDAVFNQGAVGTEFPIDVELIERVEFVPGPGSAIYGSSAFFGVINVITKTGGANSGTELAALGASFDTAKGRATFSKKTENGTELLINASRFESKGQDLYFPEFDDPQSNGGIAQGLDHDQYKRLFIKLAKGGLTFESFFAERIKGIPTASYGQQFNDPRSRAIDEYRAASLSYQRALSSTLEFYGILTLNRYKYDANYIYASQSESVNRDIARAHSWGSELRLLSTAIRNHRIIAGIEYQDDFKRAMENFDDPPRMTYLDNDHPKHGYGVYVQDEIHLMDALIVNAGLRHDHDSEGEKSSNVRLGLIYKASPELSLKWLYGTAFRPANAYERYYLTDAARFKANAVLRSEEIKTHELIAEYFPSDRMRASASIFEYRFNDLISLTSDPVDGLLFYSNVESAQSHGAEFEVEWLGKGGSRLKASVAFQHAKDSSTGQWLTNSPKRMGKLNYSVPVLGDAARASLEYQWTGKRRTSLGDDIGAFGILNINLFSNKLARNLEISAGVANLLDQRYADGPSEEHFDNNDPPRFLRSIGQNGRNWRASLTYRF
jgi:iron complex outermembrane receptor protein